MSSKRVDVTVTLDDAWREKSGAVVRKLNAHGFELRDTLDAIGVVLGSVPERSYDGLSGVEGVASVERNRTDYRAQSE